jgi:hypothetical protein
METYRPNQKLITRAVTTLIALSACDGMSAYAQKKAALEEVIVTAQKKDENLQTVPMTGDYR